MFTRNFQPNVDGLASEKQRWQGLIQWATKQDWKPQSFFFFFPDLEFLSNKYRLHSEKKDLTSSGIAMAVNHVRAIRKLKAPPIVPVNAIRKRVLKILVYFLQKYFLQCNLAHTIVKTVLNWRNMQCRQNRKRNPEIFTSFVEILYWTVKSLARARPKTKRRLWAVAEMGNMKVDYNFLLAC